MHPEPAGEWLTLLQIWDLSKLWYHNRLAPEYHGRGPEEVAAIFRAAGLTSGFWSTTLPAQAG